MDNGGGATVTKPPAAAAKQVRGAYLTPEEQRIKRARRKVGQMTLEEREQLPEGSIEFEAHLQLLEEAAAEQWAKEAQEKWENAKKLEDPQVQKKIYWKTPTDGGWMPATAIHQSLKYSFEPDLFGGLQPSPKMNVPKLPAAPMLPGMGNPIYLEMNGSKVFLGHATQIIAEYPPVDTGFFKMNDFLTKTPKAAPTYTIKLTGPQMENVLNLLGLHNACGNPTCADHIVKVA